LPNAGDYLVSHKGLLTVSKCVSADVMKSPLGSEPVRIPLQRPV